MLIEELDPSEIKYFYYLNDAIEQVISQNHKKTFNKRLELIFEEARTRLNLEIVFCKFKLQDYESKDFLFRNIFDGPNSLALEIADIYKEKTVSDKKDINLNGQKQFISLNLNKINPLLEGFIGFGFCKDKLEKSLKLLNALLQGLAKTVGNKILQADYGIRFHNFNIELDQVLDQYNLTRAVKESIQILRKYTKSKLILVAFKDDQIDTPNFKTIIFNGQNFQIKKIRTNNPVENIFNLDSKQLAENLKNLFGFENYYRDLLLKKVGQIRKEIGAVFIELDDYLQESFISKNLLKIFVTKLDSRIINYHSLKYNLDRLYDPKIVNVLLENPEAAEVYLKPKSEEICMIFADIVSFSRLSSYLDKEIVLNIIYEFINRCKEIIFKYGAVYDKAIGDCVVALVGPPFYTNDSLKNSLIGIKICQEMVKACDYMNEQFQKELFFNNEQFVIGISVGLNTGKVIVGEVGPPGTVDFTALGHEMNLAARIQAHAVKNQILVSQNIFDLVENSGKNKSKLGFYLKEQTPFKPKNMAPENVYSVES